MSLLLLVGVVGQAHSQEPAPLRVVTFNLRYDNPGDGVDAWPNRREFVAELVRDFAADAIGIQEGLAHQVDFLIENCPGYQLVGCGRDDGHSRGEFTALLVRKERLAVEAEGRRWLSDTPESPGSKHWGNSITRMFVWADLLDRTTQRRLRVYNTHWDHQSQVARERSAQAMLAHAAKRQPADLPVVLMGDLNAEATNPARIALTAEGTGLFDCYALAGDNDPGGTFHGFSGKPGQTPIDWIIVSHGFEVAEAKIERTERNGRYPSDHFPVIATLRWRD